MRRSRIGNWSANRSQIAGSVKDFASLSRAIPLQYVIRAQEAPMRSLSAAIVPVVLATVVAHAADNPKTKKKDDPSQIGNRDTGKCLNFYSIEKEIALGKQLSEEVMRQVKKVDDPLLSEQVNRIGQNLVRN